MDAISHMSKLKRCIAALHCRGQGGGEVQTNSGYGGRWLRKMGGEGRIVVQIEDGICEFQRSQKISDLAETDLIWQFL
jgi:hypothetical protein